MARKLTIRTVGFLASLFLTLAAFLIVIHPEWFHLKDTLAIYTIFSLATIQSGVQFIFFLDIWREEGPRWNLGVFISTILIVFVIIAFSIWVMNHLNDNMMPWMAHGH